MRPKNSKLAEFDQALAFLNAQASQEEIKKAYKTISDSYRSKRSIRLKSLELQLAYCQIRMPATVAVLRKIFSHLSDYQNSLKTLLDLGTGPGSVVWAACDYLQSIKDLTLVDQQSGLMELGQNLIKNSSLQKEITWIQSDLAHLDSKVLDQTYDLVTVSYVLNELDQKVRNELIDKAWERATQYLVVVEPGTPEGFLNIQSIRQKLIEKGAYILAPCTHEQTCPMSKQDWCHFSIRLHRSKFHQHIKGSLAYEDEKYSYLIASKEKPKNRAEARILKKPLKSRGLVELELCNNEGLSRQKISKSKGLAYKNAAKLKWGDPYNNTH